MLFGIIGLLVNIPITICITVIPPLPSLPLSPPSLSLPHPPSLPTLRPLPTLSPPSSLPLPPSNKFIVLSSLRKALVSSLPMSNPSMYVCAKCIVSCAKFMDRPARSTHSCAIHGFLRKVWIHRLRSAIHGLRRSTDCAQQNNNRYHIISLKASQP